MAAVMEFKNYQLSKKSYDIDTIQYSALLSEAGLEETSFKSLLTDNKVSVIPFPQMKGSEERVWTIYCPTKTKIEEYKDFIPVEALEILRDHRHHFNLGKKEELEVMDAPKDTKVMYGYITIWSEAKEVVDPILVGTIITRGKYGEPGSGFWHDISVQHYLLAQWGEALKPFEEIYKIVKERMIEGTKMAIQSKMRQLQNHIGGEELDVLNYLNCKTNEILPYELRAGIDNPNQSSNTPF